MPVVRLIRRETPKPVEFRPAARVVRFRAKAEPNGQLLFPFAAPVASANEPDEDAPEVNRIPFAAIVRTVSIRMDISVEAMMASGRNKETSKARMHVFWLARCCTDLSLPRIGSLLGGKDHTSVLSAYRRLSEIYGIPLPESADARKYADNWFLTGDWNV